MLEILFDDVSRVNRSRLSIRTSRATSAIRGSGLEVGACHDELCDPLATDTAETGCDVGDCGSTH